ncbi:hypothetical protein [Streptomyces sp. NPDC023838]|uniref:hypothetical protein n=1 Tax=Streptomyces sp. NPDC023838 TaxID=3154325 RepID=UPI00340E0AE9
MFEVVGDGRVEQSDGLCVADGVGGDVEANDAKGVRPTVRGVEVLVPLDQFVGREVLGVPPTCIRWPRPPRSNTFSELVALAARAAELVADDDRSVGAEHLEQTLHRVTPTALRCSSASRQHRMAADGLVS